MLNFRRILSIFSLALALGTHEVRAQFVYGNTGLLHLPTAEMNPDKTFLFGGSYLNCNALPSWTYNTYNYYFDVTLFPFLEVSYSMMLFSGDALAEHLNSHQRFDKWANQDRNFSFRLRLLEEGRFCRWMPQIVFGANDALHGISSIKALFLSAATTSSGYLGRFFLCASKHFNTYDAGMLGVHLALMYNNREDFLYRGLGAGVDYRLTLQDSGILSRIANGFDFRAEYDTRAINLGFGYSVWKDHVNFVAEWYRCRYFSCGLYMKFVLQ